MIISTCYSLHVFVECTFIILEKTDDARPQTETEEVASMLGDVNVFLNTDNESNDVYAELEIMIAG